MDNVLVRRIADAKALDPEKLPLLLPSYKKHLEQILDNDNNKRVLPGVRELLQRATEAGHINSLLTTNFKVGAECKLRSVGLLEAADGGSLFVGGGYGDYAPEKWDAAQEALSEIEKITGAGFAPFEVILIGDGLYDVKTAKTLGFTSVAVTTGWTTRKVLEEANPDILLDDLTELKI
jgi:phosphoglycolate phosphatase-like HAD superfamily hydrolase